MKIVINTCFGGYGLSQDAYKELGIPWDGYGFKFSEYNERTNPDLVRVVEKLRNKANGKFASLKVVKIPDDVQWHIEEYDGVESIHENHRVWE